MWIAVLVVAVQLVAWRAAVVLGKRAGDRDAARSRCNGKGDAG